MSDTLIENAYLKHCEEAGEPSWLLMRRREAWERSQDMAIPRFEKTDIRRWKLEKATPGPSPRLDAAHLISKGATAQIVTVNGRASKQGIPPELEAKGLVLVSLEDALQKMPERLEPYLFAKDEPNGNLLSMLHRTYTNGGVVLIVPRGVEVADPIEIVQGFGSADAYPHTLVVVEPMARVTVVETFVSLDAAPLTLNAALEAHVGEGGFLRYAGVQKLSQEVSMVHPRNAYLGKDAEAEWTVVEAGTKRLVTNNQTMLEGDGSKAQSYAIFLLDGKTEMEFQTSMFHGGRNSVSDMDSKGVVKDQAKVAYTGYSSILRGAKGAQTWQKEKTLMLSPDSRADLIPMLMIDDEDVQRAGHAAAAGQVDAAQLYYLMCRGIPEAEALLLLVNGFLGTILDRIPVEEVREEIQALAERKVKG